MSRQTKLLKLLNYFETFIKKCEIERTHKLQIPKNQKPTFFAIRIHCPYLSFPPLVPGQLELEFYSEVIIVCHCWKAGVTMFYFASFRKPGSHDSVSVDELSAE